MPFSLEDVTLAVLAGGKARRMGGDDKGLLAVADKPMVKHVIDRVRRDSMPAMLIANRNIELYRQFQLPIYQDSHPDYPGPLAGIAEAMAHSTTPLVLICPCDTPMLPEDLAEKMLAKLNQGDFELVVANDGERDHPVLILAKISLLASVNHYLAAGERKIDLWYPNHKLGHCQFDDPDAFANINSPQQLDELESVLKEQ